MSILTSRCPAGRHIAALGPVAKTDTKLLIHGLFQKGRVLAQDGILQQSTYGRWHALLAPAFP